MISGKEKFYALVQRGRDGFNIGLPIGLPKLEKYMDGLLPGVSYLVAAQSGVGKTTFTLYSFIYKPLKSYLEGKAQIRDPYWIMFNLEMTQEEIYAKLISMYIYDKYGIQLTFKELFSRGDDTRLSDEHFEIVKSCEEFLDILDKRIIFHDGSLNAEKYQKIVLKDLEKFGTFTSNGTFMPNNENQTICVIIDHMSLIRARPGKSKKEEMDDVSSYSVYLRNKYHISPIHVMQFNRNANNSERLRQGQQEPDVSDFKDSGAIYEDSQVVIALHSPIKFKLSSYRGYNIKKLGHRFLSCILLKSRFGVSDIIDGLGYYGECGIFRELPKSEDIIDYDKYLSPDWEIDTFQESDKRRVNFNI